MTTPVRRRSITPVLATAAVADAPHAPAGAAPHFAAVLNATLLELEYTDDAPVPRPPPTADVRAATGALIVDGIVFPGLRFGS